MEKWLCLIAGGVAGTVFRYVLAGVVYTRWGTIFPYGTLAVNLLGCFLVGFFDAMFERKFLLSPHYRILLMTGFCGAFTTFSTFIFETNGLLRDSQFMSALLNVVLSVVLGFVVFRLGVFLGEVI